MAIGTQPLSMIMEEKIKSSPVRTAVLTMKGNFKKKVEEMEVQASSPLQEIIAGLYPILLGHPESWSNVVGQDVLYKLQKQDNIILVFIDEMHQGLDDFWSSIRYVNIIMN